MGSCFVLQVCGAMREMLHVLELSVRSLRKTSLKALHVVDDQLLVLEVQGRSFDQPHEAIGLVVAGSDEVKRDY